jgi:hypothetical protein
MEAFLAVSDWITKYFDGIAIILGIISAVPIFWTWYSLTLGQKRKERQWTKNAIQNIHGKIQCVLIIDLLPNKDIKTPVLRYLKQNEQLKDIPDELVLHINHESSTTPENLTLFAKELQSIHKSLQQLGADSIHLFFAGPGIAATLIGTEFGNSISVYLYHHDKTYENFGLMNRRYI